MRKYIDRFIKCERLSFLIINLRVEKEILAKQILYRVKNRLFYNQNMMLRYVVILHQIKRLEKLIRL